MNRTGQAASAAHLDDGDCADLVLNLGDPAAREEALDHAAGCPSCEARLRAHASAAERARADWRVRSHPVPSPVSGDPARPPAHRVTRIRRAWRDPRLLSLAAAAALLAAVALPLIQRRPVTYDASSWLPTPGEEIRIREGEEADSHLAAGLLAYRDRDLATADRELSVARASGASDQLRRLYLAHVRIERGDARGSLALLRGLDWRLIPEPWRRQGAFLLARALRANGETSSADSIARALRELDPGTPFVP